ncbi:hypothetical protein [Fodinicola feengrottensis]|uniref:DUF3618 domain-containing protein n=1 Tax=Fodinicola feengrottensis TaxID=435914 RepID=A0ABN2IYN0_9ACTN|nr:hypothetical protein [Fodinicola feengrottensis]
MSFGSKSSTRERAAEISAEFGTGVGHWENAASAAVTNARDAVKPRVDQLLASLAPVVEAAVQAQSAHAKSAKKATRKWQKKADVARKDAKNVAGEAKRRTKRAVLAVQGEKMPSRWPVVVGAFAIGAAAGALGAALLARRGEEMFDQYGMPLAESEWGTTGEAVAQKAAAAAQTAASQASSAADKTANTISGAAQTAADKTKSAGDKLSHRTSQLAGSKQSTS